MCNCKKASCRSCYAKDMAELSTGNTLSSCGSTLNNSCPSDCNCKKKSSSKPHPKSRKVPHSTDHCKKSSKTRSSHCASSSHPSPTKAPAGSSARPSSSASTRKPATPASHSHTSRPSSSSRARSTDRKLSHTDRIENLKHKSHTSKSSHRSHSRHTLTHDSASHRETASNPPVSEGTSKRRAASSSKNCPQTVEQSIPKASNASAAKPPACPKSKGKTVCKIATTPTSRSAWFDSSRQDPLCREVLAAINRERQAVSLPPITLNAVLNKCAAKHNFDQANVQGAMTHVGSDGKSVRDRLKGFEYSASWIGENVAYGQNSVEWSVRSLMNSPGHRKNILKEKAKEMGVHGGVGKNGLWYWTQIFTSGSM